MSRILDSFETDLDASLENLLRIKHPSMSSYRILRKSVDARKGRPRFVYRLEVFEGNEKASSEKIQLESLPTASKVPPVIIVGTGPAGLFAALRLAERGIPSQIFERGSQTTERLKAISRHWRYGELQADNNVCYGEGGAGLYSDGKLITRIKSPYIPYVLDRLVQFGAPEEIKYLANPHVGSDRIRKLIPPIRNFLISKSCQFFFNTKVTRILFENEKCIGIETQNGDQHLSPHVILATGHSATEIYEDLAKSGVEMEGKSFAIGFRIEHPQKLINKIQYKAAAEHPALGAAQYKLTRHDPKENVGVYSFCMCPGGYVIASSTEEDGIVSNGMSNYARNSAYANAALVVSVNFEERFGSERFAGLQFIREIEKRAKQQVLTAGGKKELPAQSVIDFLNRKKSSEVSSGSSPSKAISAELHQLVPSDIYSRISESLEYFHTKLMPGFISKQAQLFGVETRTSAPLRIPRNSEDFQSVSHQGLYPTGEGAGYAGGITSAAVDGVRVAESIYQKFAS